MPSFDIMSEVDQPSLRNAVEQANRKIEGRHEVGCFKKTLGDFLKSESFQIVQTGRRWSLSLPLWIVARLAP